MFGFFKKKKEFDEATYQAIKRLVAGLPEEPGWAATYEKELTAGTIAKLEEEGFQVEKKTRTNGRVYYKIQKSIE